MPAATDKEIQLQQRLEVLMAELNKMKSAANISAASPVPTVTPSTRSKKGVAAISTPVVIIPIPVVPLPIPVVPLPTPVVPLPTPVVPLPIPVVPLPTPAVPTTVLGTGDEIQRALEFYRNAQHGNNKNTTKLIGYYPASDDSDKENIDGKFIKLL